LLSVGSRVLLSRAKRGQQILSGSRGLFEPPLPEG